MSGVLNGTLLHAYVPLLIWPGLGYVLFRLLPDSFPRWLGRGLYWVGIPVEIFSLVRHAQFGSSRLTPLLVGFALLTGIGLGWGLWSVLKWRGWVGNPAEATQGAHDSSKSSGKSSGNLSGSGGLVSGSLDPLGLEPTQPQDLPDRTAEDRALQGSMILAATLGNTGFVGLAIVPSLIESPYLSWVVLYSVTHNILGTYGLGALLARYFGHLPGKASPGKLLLTVLMVPSVWAFSLGVASQPLAFPPGIELLLERSIWLVIPAALLLMGMRLSQVQSWNSVGLALGPVLVKLVVLPGIMAIGVTLIGLPSPARLALVLMSAMPSAFGGLILAEEYNLNRDLIASAIALSTVLMLVVLPLWVVLLG